MDAYDGLQRAPSIAEWVSASCGQFSSQERNTMLRLEGNKSKLSANDTLLLKMLSEKDRIPSLIDQNRWAHWRNPMDMILQGCSTSLFQASQQWSTISS